MKHLKKYENFHLFEGIKIDLLMKNGKPNNEILVVPNKFYKDKEELDQNIMRPLNIKKEEGNKDMFLFKGNSDIHQYPIENEEISDIITYEEALKKIR